MAWWHRLPIVRGWLRLQADLVERSKLTGEARKSWSWGIFTVTKRYRQDGDYGPRLIRFEWLSPESRDKGGGNG